MSLHSTKDYEIGWITLHKLISSTCRSRAGANHLRTCIFEGGTKDTPSPKDNAKMRNYLEDKCVEVRLKAQKFADKVLQ